MNTCNMQQYRNTLESTIVMVGLNLLITDMCGVEIYGSGHFENPTATYIGTNTMFNQYNLTACVIIPDELTKGTACGTDYFYSSVRRQ